MHELFVWKSYPTCGFVTHTLFFHYDISSKVSLENFIIRLKLPFKSVISLWVLVFPEEISEIYSTACIRNLQQLRF